MKGTAQLKRYLLRRPGLVRLAVVAALFLLWEIAARFWIAPMFLSPPSKVIVNFGAAGLWEYANNATWIQLHTARPGVIGAGHINAAE